MRLLNSPCWLAVVGVLVLAGVCPAQERPDKERDRDRERERRPRDVHRLGIRDTERFLQRLKEELRLTDSQQGEARRLLEGYKKEVDELKRQAQPPLEYGKQLAGMREEIKKARDDGDQQKLQEVLGRMRAMREVHEARQNPVREKIEAANKTLHDQLVAMLGQGQKEAFEPLWAEALGLRRPGQSYRENPRQLRALVMRLPQLTEEQKEKLDDLFRANEQALRGVKDRAERTNVMQKLYDGVVAILTPEQKQKLESDVARREGRFGREDKKP